MRDQVLQVELLQESSRILCWSKALFKPQNDSFRQRFLPYRRRMAGLTSYGPNRVVSRSEDFERKPSGQARDRGPGVRRTQVTPSLVLLMEPIFYSHFVLWFIYSDGPLPIFSAYLLRSSTLAVLVYLLWNPWRPSAEVGRLSTRPRLRSLSRDTGLGARTQMDHGLRRRVCVCVSSMYIPQKMFGIKNPANRLWCHVSHHWMQIHTIGAIVGLIEYRPISIYIYIYIMSKMSLFRCVRSVPSRHLCCL